MISVAAICVELYLVFENMDDMYRVCRFISYVSTLLTQLALFCFMADAVSEEV